MARRPTLPRASRQRGFSLLELLVVLAIALVVGAMALVQVASAMRTYRLQEATTIVSSKLMDARFNALKRNRAAWLQIDAVARTMEVQVTQAGAIQTVGTPSRLTNGVAFGPGAPAQVAFDALGRLGAVEVIPIVDAQGTQRTLTVSLTGAVTVN